MDSVLSLLMVTGPHTRIVPWLPASSNAVSIEDTAFSFAEPSPLLSPDRVPFKYTDVPVFTFSV